ncbi:MAG: 30S ribosome-binding factor RbfA [Pseudomonadota bacterium]
MAKEYARPQRVADFIQRELAMLIQQEIRDPRISFVSVTGVDVSRDLSSAKVHVTFLQEEEERKEAQREERVRILNKAAGFLRSHLARESTMRHIPQIRFYFDTSIERGSHLTNLINKAVSEDESNYENESE